MFNDFDYKNDRPMPELNEPNKFAQVIAIVFGLFMIVVVLAICIIGIGMLSNFAMTLFEIGWDTASG
jgi:hypothetical protein